MRVKTTLVAAYVVALGSFVLTRPAEAEQGQICDQCETVGNYDSYVLQYCESPEGPGIYAHVTEWWDQPLGDSCNWTSVEGEYEFDCEVCPQ